MFSPEADRYSATEALIDAARSHAGNTAISMSTADGSIQLADLLDSVIIPDVKDGIVSLSSAAQDSDTLPVIIAYPGETFGLGDGFGSQSPHQIEQSISFVEKWGLSKDIATSIIANLAISLTAGAQQIAVSMREGANGTTAAASGLFLPKDALGSHEPTTPSTAKALHVRARPLIALASDTEPAILGHEIVHAVERIEAPIKPIMSQRTFDMRGLREELKAYQMGAKMTLAAEGKTSLGEYELEDIIKNNQLLVEFVRLTANRQDSDPYRTTPNLVAGLKSAGLPLEFILHNRIDIEAALAHLSA